MIIRYPRVSVKQTWQVYVTSELKIKLLCFFTLRTMVWVFIGLKNIYIYLSAILKFAAIQNESKRANFKASVY